MQLLIDRIRSEGKVRPGNILKVDSFLNHQIDVTLVREMALEFHRKFGNCGVNKILTIEASGIAIACFVAQVFDCPVVFAKKTASSNIAPSVYTTEVKSYTKNTTFSVLVSKEYLHEADRILVIDDFLATGAALEGLLDICKQAGATVVGCGIAIEKGFQDGGKNIRERGIPVHSLAIIDKFNEDGTLTFRSSEE